jgi:glutathione reductase (NADPH)
MQEFDLIIIGTGSAGATVASKARSAGRNVSIIDSLPFGGTCALRGCDPKKVLLGNADLIDWSRRMQKQHTVSGELSISWPDLMQFKRSFTGPVPEEREQAFEKQGIRTFHGNARFTGPTTLQVETDVLHARHVLIASGATPAPLNIPGEEHLIDSTGFLELKELPKEIVFVGGGYIALEFTHLATRAGAEVTVLHRGERILEGFDPDLVSQLADSTRELGATIHTGMTVKAITKKAARFTVCASQGDKELCFDCDLAVHAAGRVPNLDGLDLDTAGVDRERNGIMVNEYLQSVSNPAVYAAGDAVATRVPRLTPVAAYDGIVAAQNLLKGNHMKAQYDAIPTVVFTIPPLASVGLSERSAKEKGLRFKTNYMKMGDWYSSRRVVESTAAFKVLVEEESNLILGAHLLGPAAEETINLFTLAIRSGVTAEKLKHILFAYPTHASDVAYML